MFPARVCCRYAHSITELPAAPEKTAIRVPSLASRGRSSRSSSCRRASSQEWKILRNSSLFVIVWLALISGCTRLPSITQTSLKSKNLPELQEYLLSHDADVDLFRSSGPFAVTLHENRELRLSSTERINTDLFLSGAPGKAPLVIFLHGYDSSKEAHSKQAMHLASWGMQCLTLQLSRSGPWVSNARTLARIVSLIHRSPEAIDSRFDVNKIVLVGHSFGASAAAIALAEGAPAAGGILLDPAAVGKDLPNFLRRINRPVMVLGADDEVSSARNRDYFYRFIRSGIAEVSIRDAAHEDAQYPSEWSLQHFGLDPYTTEESQITFVSALTAAAMSLSATGTFDYAWTSFGRVFQNGKFFNAKKK
jgi:pimeloyl-ACP methyl ester carboxylesterase